MHSRLCSILAIFDLLSFELIVTWLDTQYLAVIPLISLVKEAVVLRELLSKWSHSTPRQGSTIAAANGYELVRAITAAIALESPW